MSQVKQLAGRLSLLGAGSDGRYKYVVAIERDNGKFRADNGHWFWSSWSSADARCGKPGRLAVMILGLILSAYGGSRLEREMMTAGLDSLKLLDWPKSPSGHKQNQECFGRYGQ